MKKRDILLVDDYGIFLDSTADLLEREGFRVVKAENGRKAIDILQQNGMKLLDAEAFGILDTNV